MMHLIGYDFTWGEDRTSIKKKLAENLKKTSSELQAHRMHESFAEAIIPLGDEPELRNRYANFQRAVRVGRLLEDLDTMAVHISYLHNKSQNININGHTLSPIVIVTALVDRIEFLDFKIEADKNIKLSGYTSWVGKSSSEVTMKLEQEISPNVWQKILDAKFLVCARDTTNSSSALMNPLNVVTNEERAIFELGESKTPKFLFFNDFF
jgi:acyl-coenzyme A thioesterase 9